MRIGTHRILIGDVLTGLATLPDASVHCCVTSPPYWGLRDYGAEGQIGLERSPDAYVDRIVAVFREVRRVLRDDGTLWLNLGDSYATGAGAVGDCPGGGEQGERWKGYRGNRNGHEGKHGYRVGPGTQPNRMPIVGLKPKDLVGIPWRVAFALQADGWYLRSDIIWCLSGGTWLYVRTDEGGICLMTVKDLRRLDPATVRLWNGKEWTRLLGMSKSKRRGDELEITLRSGERIACTPTHRFPLWGGFPVKAASELKVGDRLDRVRLPEPLHPLDTPEIGEDAAWLCGLYIAEGSRSGDTIQIAGHAKELNRWDRLRWIAHKYGGSATRTVSGNQMSIRLYGKILSGIIDQFVSGKMAHNKGFAPPVWRCGNGFIRAMIDGYLAGDGHHDIKNDRWRLGFCRNYNLERDLRAACARLGYRLTLNLSSVRYKGRAVPTFKGEIKTHTREHHNCKSPDEIVSIGRARCRDVYDLGVADEPHVFALASGILTHNSKPNPMPESVTDRPTKAHEYLFLLAKSERYYFDAEAIKEEAVKGAAGSRFDTGKTGVHGMGRSQEGERGDDSSSRNRRTVWHISTQPYSEAHFATFPEKLVEPCILAGTSEKGCCPTCGTPWRRKIERERRATRPGTGSKVNRASQHDESPYNGHGGMVVGNRDPLRHCSVSKTTGWEPGCKCDHADPVPCVVLDPFSGSGTTGSVACPIGRNYIGCELNPEYAAMAERRIGKAKRPETYADVNRVVEAPLFVTQGDAK